MDKTISLTLKIIGILAGITLLYFVRDIIAYLLMAFVLSSALRPGVDFLEKKKIPRVVSALFIFVLVFLVLGLVIFLTLPSLVSEIESFTSNFPQYWQNVLDWISQFEKWMAGVPFEENIKEGITQSFQKMSQLLSGSIRVVYRFFAEIANLLFLLVVAFYLSVEKNIGKRFSHFLFAGKKDLEEKVVRYWQVAEETAGRWLQGYVILGIIVGILVYIGLSILGLKYSLIVAVLAGLFEIIPWLGPVLSGAIGVLFALLQGGWAMAFWVVIIFLVVQQFENYLIVPFVMREKVNLNPLLTIVVLFIGQRLAGVVGMLLAVPVTAILINIWKNSQKE